MRSYRDGPRLLCSLTRLTTISAELCIARGLIARAGAMREDVVPTGSSEAAVDGHRVR